MIPEGTDEDGRVAVVGVLSDETVVVVNWPCFDRLQPSLIHPKALQILPLAPPQAARNHPHCLRHTPTIPVATDANVWCPFLTY